MSTSNIADPANTPREREIDLLKKLRLEQDALPQEQGVLLSDQIRACVSSFQLIDPFHPAQLKAASYRLTVGERYALNGQPNTLGEHQEIRIEPFQVAVIQTRERINMPRNLIARWNIKVSRAYEGLIWAGGPQVDPGYAGHLFCPIYNLSNKVVALHFGDQIAVIDFIKTTPFHPNACEVFDRPPAAVVLEDYPIQWQSALHTYATQIKEWEQKLASTQEEMESRLAQFKGGLDVFVGITFAVMGVLISALAIKPEKPVASVVPILFSLAALVFSLLAILQGRARPDKAPHTRRWFAAVVLLSFMLGIIFHWAVPILSRWWPQL
jgi:dCTP deaminase